MRTKDKHKTKKYRGGKCDEIICSNVNNEKLKTLCDKLGGITNLIEPFIDKKNPLYKN